MIQTLQIAVFRRDYYSVDAKKGQDTGDGPASVRNTVRVRRNCVNAWTDCIKSDRMYEI